MQWLSLLWQEPELRPHHPKQAPWAWWRWRMDGTAGEAAATPRGPRRELWQPDLARGSSWRWAGPHPASGTPCSDSVVPAERLQTTSRYQWERRRPEEQLCPKRSQKVPCAHSKPALALALLVLLHVRTAANRRRRTATVSCSSALPGSARRPLLPGTAARTRVQ
jgi:hypothetical protein